MSKKEKKLILAKDKQLCPIRMHRDQYLKVRAKLEEDGISYQKFTEVVFNAYLNNNKEIGRLITRFTASKGPKLKRTDLNEIERDELLRIIENEHSPLRELGEVIEEALKDEK